MLSVPTTRWGLSHAILWASVLKSQIFSPQAVIGSISVIMHTCLRINWHIIFCIWDWQLVLKSKEKTLYYLRKLSKYLFPFSQGVYNVSLFNNLGDIIAILLYYHKRQIGAHSHRKCAKMEKIQRRRARSLCRDDLETHRAVYIFITGPSAENKWPWSI